MTDREARRQQLVSRLVTRLVDDEDVSMYAHQIALDQAYGNITPLRRHANWVMDQEDQVEPDRTKLYWTYKTVVIEQLMLDIVGGLHRRLM